MFLIPSMAVLFIMAVVALRLQGVCWLYTTLFSSLSLVFPFYLGLWGFVIAGLYVGALWKVELSSLR